MCDAQMLAGIESSFLAAQPLSVHKVCSGQIHPGPCSAEPAPAVGARADAPAPAAEGKASLPVGVPAQTGYPHGEGQKGQQKEPDLRPITEGGVEKSARAGIGQLRSEAGCGFNLD